MTHRPAQPTVVKEHVPVLLQPVVEALVWRSDGTYVDATFGRGGHSRALLARLGAQARLFGCDCDPQAYAAAQTIEDQRFFPLKTRFSGLRPALERLHALPVSGILADLGVSSPQLDEAERGFSFRQEAELDMRMDPKQGESVAAWLARASIDEIRQVIEVYGEERFAARIAKAVVQHRNTLGPIRSTVELAALVARVVPKKGRIHPATRTFQALRIHVNRELEELDSLLAAALACLEPGGRLAVISFHSLEDRRVKRFMRQHAGLESRAEPNRLERALGIQPSQPPAELDSALQRIRPTESESRNNPRARSAVLRVAVKLDQKGCSRPAIESKGVDS